MNTLNELKEYIEKCEEAVFDAGVKSCLQNEPGISLKYMVYRWVQFISHSAIMIGAMLELHTGTLKIHTTDFYAKWWLYLTSWVLLLNMVQSLMGAVILTMAYLRRSILGRANHVYGVPGKLVDTYMVMYSVAVNFSVFMAFGYWELRVGFPKALTAERKKIFGCYGLGTFLMLVDLFVVEFPYKMNTGLYALAAMLAYLFATWLHFVSGSVDAYKKNRYIYPGLDWSKPVVAAEHAAFCVIILEVLNCSFLWSLCQLRRYILDKYAPMEIDSVPALNDTAQHRGERHHHSFESSHDHSVHQGPANRAGSPRNKEKPH